jgi:hypothetical protein
MTQDEDHEAGIAREGLQRILDMGCPLGREGDLLGEAQKIASETISRLSRVSPARVGSVPQDEDHEAAVRALMKRWIDQANAERYIGGPNTSPMVEPEEYDIDDPPEGIEEQARCDVECVVAALSPARVGSVAVEDVERLKNELQALVDWFSDAPFLRAERLLYDLSRSSTDRPEQPEPDVLGGQPPAEPETT